MFIGCALQDQVQLILCFIQGTIPTDSFSGWDILVARIVTATLDVQLVGTESDLCNVFTKYWITNLHIPFTSKGTFVLL